MPYTPIIHHTRALTCSCTDGAGGKGTWGKESETWKYEGDLKHFLDGDDPNFDPEVDERRPMVHEVYGAR